MSLQKRKQRESSVEIIIETKSCRQHIKANGIIPTLVVALYFIVLVLGAFEKMTKGLFSKIFCGIRKLRKHNYYFTWIIVSVVYMD